MNKVITAVGLAVVSAASVQAQSTDTSGLAASQDTKAWYLAATLRGFYDDNYLTQPKSFPKVTDVAGAPYTGHPLSSWGTEAIPSFGITHSAEGTTMSASYVYDVRWYENKSVTDQSHQLNLHLDHPFSDKYKLSVGESFVIAQEPTVIDQEGPVSVPLRVEGNNMHNTAQLDFTDSLTKELDLHIGYANSLYVYPQLEDSVIGYPWGIPTVGYPVGNDTSSPQPSRSALLNRMEQLFPIDLRWKPTERTTGILGYQFGQTAYTSGEYIIYPNDEGGYASTTASGNPAPGFHSNIRDSYSHYVYMGADESFSQELNGSVRVGGEYIDYYNYDTSRLSPYIDASLTDQYQPTASAQIGVKHTHNGTDVAGTIGDLGASGQSAPVLDEESTAIYFSDNHKLSDKLTASVMGQAQLSSFVGGGPQFDGKMDQFFILQINLKYQVNPWFSTEAGYNYSRLKSDLANRAYTRDFMYMGVRATY